MPLATHADWLLCQDVAKLAGVGVQTVRRWDRSGRLPAVRTPGGFRLFSRAAVEAFVAARVAARVEDGDGVGTP